MLSFLVAAAVVPMAVPGPQGAIAGTFMDAGKGTPVVLIIPGSGPTDRDGNNPLGVSAAPYRLLAEALAERGVSTLRADKRGLFGSKLAIPDPNVVSIADYSADAHAWVSALRERTGTRCVWLLGHSEGALIALAAAQDSKDICGIILVAAPGRKLGAVIRQQLTSNPANAALLPQAASTLQQLESGKTVDAADIAAPLLGLFNPKVQPFLIDLLRQDPIAMVASTRLPLLIIQGGKDLQVSRADAEALHAARADAQLLQPANMNHILKDVLGNDRASNLAAYSDPSLPIDVTLADGIAAFVKSTRQVSR